MTRKALSLTELVMALLPVARGAGELIMKHYQQGGAVQHKPDSSPVTEADREADAFIVAALRRLTPELPVVSEEGAQPDVAGAEYFWLVDPLDGTRSFVRGKGYFTVNIGLIGAQRLPVAGVIYEPVAQELYWGYEEGGAMHQRGQGAPEVIHMRAPEAGKLRAIISHRNLDGKTEDFLDRQHIKERVPCASSIKFCRLAEGEADIYPRFASTMEWDTAAGHAILSAAGGEVVTPAGELFLYGKPRFENGHFIARSRAYAVLAKDA